MICWHEFAETIKTRIFFFVLPSADDEIVNNHLDAISNLPDHNHDHNDMRWLSLKLATSPLVPLLLVSKGFSQDLRFALEAHLRELRAIQRLVRSYQSYWKYMLEFQLAVYGKIITGKSKDGQRGYWLWHKRSTCHIVSIERMLRSIDYAQQFGPCWQELPRELVREVIYLALKQCVGDYGLLEARIHNTANNCFTDGLSHRNRGRYFQQRMQRTLNLAFVSREYLGLASEVLHEHEAQVAVWVKDVKENYDESLHRAAVRHRADASTGHDTKVHEDCCLDDDVHRLCAFVRRVQKVVTGILQGGKARRRFSEESCC